MLPQCLLKRHHKGQTKHIHGLSVCNFSLLVNSLKSKDGLAVSCPKCQNSKLLDQAHPQVPSTFNKDLSWICPKCKLLPLLTPLKTSPLDLQQNTSSYRNRIKICIFKIPSNVFQSLFVKITTHEYNKIKHSPCPSLSTVKTKSILEKKLLWPLPLKGPHMAIQLQEFRSGRCNPFPGVFL